MTDDERRYNPFFDPDDTDTGIWPDHEKEGQTGTESPPSDTAWEHEYYGGSDPDEFQSNPNAENTKSAGRVDAPYESDRSPVDHEDMEVLDTAIDRVVFAIVPAKSRFEAVAKGAVALDRRPTEDIFPTTYDGDTFELAYAYDENALRTFSRTWGALPDAIPLASDCGLRLFTLAREHTDWRDDLIEETEEGRDEDESGGPKDGDVHLYDEYGHPIGSRGQLVPLLTKRGPLDHLAPDEDTSETLPSYGSATEELWIVPAIAYRAVLTSDHTRAIAETRGAYREHLTCLECDDVTVHQFEGAQSYGPIDEEVDHPAGELTDLFVEQATTDYAIWECRICEASRFGPIPYD